MNQNNGNHRLAAVDVIDEEVASERTNGNFYDASNPELRPAKPIGVAKKKGWKRKLVAWCFVLLLIGGGAIVLYLLLRVNRVDVKVQADSRRDLQTPKPSPNGNNPDNTLTAEAINIARSASGADSVNNNAAPSASPNAAALSSPTPPASTRTNYSYTGNTSPVLEPLTESPSNGNSNQQTNAGSIKSANAVDLTASVQLQNHANVTQSIFVGDESAKASLLTSQTTAMRSIKSSAENKSLTANSMKLAPAVLPPFGTMLPVRTQGVIFTLRNDSYARLELMRDAAGDGWSLPKGTVFVGRTSGNEYDRAYVNVIGYIDPRDNKLVKMTGEVMGTDGAAGLSGKRLGVDRNALKNALRKVASGGMQVAGMMAGALGRGPVIIDGAGYRLATPLTDEARNAIGGNTNRSFVKVQAGQPAYVMVSDLPKAIQAVDAPGDEELSQAATSLTDRDVMELILFGSPDEVRAALPLMNDEQKRLAAKTLSPENKNK
jgi:hypothetical protein